MPPVIVQTWLGLDYYYYVVEQGTCVGGKLIFRSIKIAT